MLIFVSNLPVRFPITIPCKFTNRRSDTFTITRYRVLTTARCFSCMSRLYEAIWPVLANIYKKPRNSLTSATTILLIRQGSPL
ncbi:unnamed protein product, partial [Mesorhabditis belari]|uniref:Uncharacterized protein n=1 Tax=Mesorhabditis belari TaxID=2138241 RepID=A0AAF3FQ46_9BILA